MKLFWKNEIIEFYCHPQHEGTIPPPVPAFKHIAPWWKKLSKSISDNSMDKRDPFGQPPFTAKKCMPLLDVMSLGFTIPLQADVNIISNSDLSIIKAINPPGLEVVSFHSKDQIEAESDAIKFINYWVIKTAPGWSTLFIPPANHFNTNFTCLSGLVDTDKYPKEVNFPAIWHTPNFDGQLLSGTPLVTAIPIKRNSFDSYPKIRKMSDKEFKDIDRMSKIQKMRNSYYSNELREPRK